MTAQQLKDLESRLWKAADDLRANSKLTATEYSFPVLGLIFLRDGVGSQKGGQYSVDEFTPRAL
jgi:hypothetical protein